MTLPKPEPFGLARSAARLLSAAMYAAPNSTVQLAFAKMVSDMHAEGCSNEAVAIALCGGILDGLKSGNWPA